MTYYPCPENITVSSSEDIHDSPFNTCIGSIENLIITNTDETQLDFTSRNGQVLVSNILIQDDPDLEEIQLPFFDVTDAGNPDPGRFEITGNPALRQVDVSKLSQYTPKNFTMSNFASRLNFSNNASADQIYLYNNPDFGLSITGLPELNYLKSVGSQFAIKDIPEIHTMEIEAPGPLEWNFRGLKSVGTAIWTNVSSGIFDVDQYEVREDMVVGPSIFDEPPPVLWFPPHWFPESGDDDEVFYSMQFQNLTSVGGDLSITENTFITIDFPDLNKVSGRLAIEGNLNCTLNFNSTTRIGSLYAINNTNTALPGWFPELEEADEIYLNGYIDTIRIETWNSDFNCTQFLTQANSLGFGGTPYCNNTADDAFTAAIPPTSSTTVSEDPSLQTTSSILSPVSTSVSMLTSTSVSTSVLDSPSVSTYPPASTASPPPSNTPPTSFTGVLSQGAWAGIGVAIAVVLIGGGVLAYLLVRLATYKKKLRRQQQEHEGEAGRDDNGRPLDGSEQKELPAREYVRYEADGAQIVEVANRELASQPGGLGSYAVPMETGTPRLLVELP